MLNVVFVLTLVVGVSSNACCPRFTQRRPLLEEMKTHGAWDARLELPPCKVKDLLADAIAEFDLYRGFLCLPARWFSGPCHIPTDGIHETYAAIERAVTNGLADHYRETFLVPKCLGGYWAAYGGMMDLQCYWAIPTIWTFNHTINCAASTARTLLERTMCP